MRCLLINHSPVEGSGSGSYTQAIARHLTQRGWQSVVLTPARMASEQQQDAVVYRTITLDLQGTTRGAFPTFTGHPSSTATYQGMSAPQIEEYRRQMRAAIRSAIRDYPTDIIHTQHLFLLPHLAKETGLPVVTTCHGSELHFCAENNSGQWRGVLRDAVEGTEQIVAVSGYVARLARATCEIPESKQVVIHNGYDEKIFSPVPPAANGESSTPARGWLVAGVGRLVRYKRFDVLLKAARLIQDRRGPNSIRVVIAGDGPEREALMRLSVELKLEGVRFAGFVSQAEVAEILSAAEVTVVPSEDEPFGLVALESLACGTPVVTSASGGLPEFVNESVGALVNGWDPETWASALLRELEEGSKRLKRAEIARHASEYTWSQVVERVAGVYQNAIRRHR